MSKIKILILLMSVFFITCKQDKEKQSDTSQAEEVEKEVSNESIIDDRPVVSTHDIVFDEGSKQKLVKGRIIGRNKQIHYLEVKAGETLNLDLFADNPETTISVFTPKSILLHEMMLGEEEVKSWQHKAQEGGRYIIYVRLSSEAGHQGYTTNFDLKVSLSDQVK
jgi:hypothetical protein